MILFSILNQAESITVLGQSRAPLPKQAPSVMSDHPMEAIPEESDPYEVRVVQILVTFFVAQLKIVPALHNHI